MQDDQQAVCLCIASSVTITESGPGGIFMSSRVRSVNCRYPGCV